MPGLRFARELDPITGLHVFVAEESRGWPACAGHDGILSQHGPLRTSERATKPEGSAPLRRRLLFNHAMIDRRRTIPLIDVSTLVVGGKARLVPWKSQVWIADQIKGAGLEILATSARR